MHKRVAKSLPIVASVLALAACSSGGDGESTGTLNLAITDSPVDEAAEVVIVFTGVELKPAGGPPFSIDFEENEVIDLLQLQNGITDELLTNRSVIAGSYEWMRLKVLAEMNQQDGSYILLESGEQCPLFVPSGAQTGLKLVRPFVVAQGGVTRLLIDFDLRKSVIEPPGIEPNYLLKPTLRLMDELEAGAIQGQVDLAALAALQGTDPCDGGLYLFSGHAATPDDTDGDEVDGADPVVYLKLEPDVVGGTVASYALPFVEAGSYTAAATCNFAVDALPDTSEYDPVAADPTMQWTAIDVTVGVNETTVVDLPAP
jgi:hypothetical protein